MRLYTPNDSPASIIQPDCETTTAIFNSCDGDEDASLRFAVDLLASGQDLIRNR
jgi:hypothetical protein